MPAFMAVLKSEKGIRSQRAAMVTHYLSRKPTGKAGEFSYSNIGYAIVGAVAEERTGRVLGRPDPRRGLEAAGYSQRRVWPAGQIRPG